MNYYKQCLLKKKSRPLIAWLPEQFAKHKKVLELKNDDQWENGWKVEVVYKIRLSEEQLRERSQDYKHTREASDI